MGKTNFSFKKAAKEYLSGSDLVTEKENALRTEEVVEAGEVTVKDFDMTMIDGDEVAVLTFDEFPGKYYWGGKALSEMIMGIVSNFDSVTECRAAYYESSEKITFKLESTRTKNNFDFTRVVLT